MKFRGLFLSIMLITSQAGAANESSTLWNNYHGNAAHTGSLNINVDPAKFRKAWNKTFIANIPLNGGLQLCHSSITDHMLYVTISVSTDKITNLAGIYAVNTSTGEPVWNVMFDDGNNYAASSPVYDNGKIYWIHWPIMPAQKTLITALDAESGQLIFNNSFDNKSEQSIFADPVMFDHHLYLGDGERFQYSLNGDTGNVEWDAPTGDYRADPTVSDNYVFRTNYPGIDVLNRITGEKSYIRLSDHSEKFYNEARPVWDENNKTLYVAIRDKSDGALFAVDIEKRLTKWSLPINSYDVQPVLINDKIYYLDAGILYEVNALTGKVNWSVKAVIDTVYKDMIATSNVIFISDMSSCKTTAVSVKTQKTVWSYDECGLLSLDNSKLYLMNFINHYNGVEITAIALK